MGYIDSHAHLTDEKLYLQIPELIEKFKENNVSKVLIICCEASDYEKALVLKKKYDLFDLAVGIHPESANEYNDEDLLILERQIQEKEVVAIGEIGLDYYWVKDNKERQRELFIKQLALADKYNLPVLIHSRDASEELYDILATHKVKRKGIMHCFSGSEEMMVRFVKLGYSISLAGPVTFKNARHSVDVAKATPIDYLFYETDCPYLAPEPFRGKLNDPSYVIYTANKIADLRNISVEELNKHINQNYQRMFEISEK